ncbi:hypothetical protein GLOTRDRAFT_126166 [Gloeophyllum trabeum ATCC 11539]|uniref:Uncharacterized protein n=1 Tax=Gloeophyllum trabeum (strain ATCC 11539 / FP-39264 / Madison 617) TaxID=670483 RepID=S7RY44_GLOTA|nr:uncharacterized protein GLOTRDRAFT_126166 [Gloeophyllum trabeum ATCC 11539]EPQ59875.1 hypothetical protein GLOTRDRAFT_126166 [Gloeophyllum trabeum ATCC 11539]
MRMACIRWTIERIHASHGGGLAPVWKNTIDEPAYWEKVVLENNIPPDWIDDLKSSHFLKAEGRDLVGVGFCGKPISWVVDDELYTLLKRRVALYFIWGNAQAWKQKSLPPRPDFF